MEIKEWMMMMISAIIVVTGWSLNGYLKFDL